MQLQTCTYFLERRLSVRRMLELGFLSAGWVNGATRRSVLVRMTGCTVAWRMPEGRRKDDSFFTVMDLLPLESIRWGWPAVTLLREKETALCT